MIKIAEYDSKAFKRERAQADADVRYIINDVAEGATRLFSSTPFALTAANRRVFL